MSEKEISKMKYSGKGADFHKRIIDSKYHEKKRGR